MTQPPAPPHADPGTGQPGAAVGDIEGFVDGFDGRRITGWAHDRAAPGRRLEIDIVAGQDILRVTADQERQDVAAAGRNDGFCGFSAVLQPDAAGRDPVHVREASTGIPLAGSPIVPAAAGPAPSGIEGYIDFVDGNRIVGWAYDRTIPGRRLRIAISVGDLTTTVTADQFRQDVAASGLNDGYCGFEFAFDLRDAGRRLIHVREVSQGLELGGSPFRPDLLNRIAALGDGKALAVLRGEAMRALSSTAGGRP